MLLRRFIDHVKTQNWTAVALDFFIVVVGVFVGLQVQEWAQERNRRSNEAAYLQRLHMEVGKLEHERSLYDLRRARVAGQLVEIVPLLNAADEISLTDEQCFMLADMSYLTVPPSGLPTATELLAAGQLNILRSLNVRSALLDFDQQSARARELIAEVARASVNVSQVYPDLFRIRLIPDDTSPDGYDRSVQCDAQEMRENGAFMNDLNDTTFAYQGYYKRGVVPVSESLHRLHAALDESLSLVHGAE